MNVTSIPRVTAPWLFPQPDKTRDLNIKFPVTPSGASIKF